VICTAAPAARPSRTFDTNTWFVPPERSDTKASRVPFGRPLQDGHRGRIVGELLRRPAVDGGDPDGTLPFEHA